ncbi:LCP family protein [Planomicrobium sp. CPCC 101079]|uniref:LCP family protein n=1 Tax=Planomicrobium sp. CPCC 101079 TaxID=2599618 RepID=UPI0011B5233F|nr:LCP family protein [Planomicrobium sp. CPCC 101079]TWT00956.1 LytR family transcriptional regulator [Planomicrobium sp. CPCC 101079]
MEQEQQIRKNRRKKKRFRLRGILFLLLIAVLAIGAYVFMQFQSGHKLAEENSELPTIAFDGDPENQDYENILLLGVDARGEEISRTDTMMLVSHNKQTDEVKVTSFMRDIYAAIPGYQSYKLNTAYYLGVKETGQVEDGVALLADTLRTMMGVEIHHFAMIDFESFEKLVDIAAPNGVEIDVEKKMSKNIGVTLNPGVQNLNGKELLGYARFRADKDGDFGRVRRQQQVVSAMKDELISVSAIPKYPKLAGAAQGYIQTDLTVADQIKMATSIAMNGGTGVERLTLPVENSYSFTSYSHAGSVIEMDIEQNKQALSEFLSQPLD